WSSWHPMPMTDRIAKPPARHALLVLIERPYEIGVGTEQTCPAPLTRCRFHCRRRIRSGHRTRLGKIPEPRGGGADHGHAHRTEGRGNRGDSLRNGAFVPEGRPLEGGSSENATRGGRMNDANAGTFAGRALRFSASRFGRAAGAFARIDILYKA